jgi:tRNA A-37 threonylcarbamoyl transferase component Bud32
MDFETLWTLPMDAVLSRNRRGAGWSEAGVVEALPGHRKALLKRQQAYYCRPIWNGLRATPTLLREARFLTRADAAGVPVPSVVCQLRSRPARMILAVEWLANAAALQTVAAGLPVAERARLLSRVGGYFQRLHAARICHGALYDRHVLVAADGAITLIDFEKARLRMSPSWAAIADLRRFIRRAPWLTEADIAALLAAYPRRFVLLHLWARWRR